MKYKVCPSYIFEPDRRVMFLFAHNDDELPYGGLIQRVSKNTQFVWLTNSDGLWYEMNMSPSAYAEARKSESIMAMREVGVSEEKLRFLGYSECEIYRRLTEVANGKEEALAFFVNIAKQIERVIEDFRPEIVFTLAFQGGNPEHDLLHIFTVSAVRGRAEVFELPEYELTILIPLRFAPWKHGEMFEIYLTEQEISRKRKMVGWYATQTNLFKRFMFLIGFFGALANRKFSISGGAEFYLGRETFASVPINRNYLTPPHYFDFLEYIGDHYDKTPISFSSMIAPIVKTIMG